MATRVALASGTPATPVFDRRLHHGHYLVWEMDAKGEFLSTADMSAANEADFIQRGAERQILQGSGIHGTPNDDGLILRETWTRVCMTGTPTNSTPVSISGSQ